MFVDDTNVFIRSKSVNDFLSEANTIVSQLNDWFIANKLSLKVNKTCYSVFVCTRNNIGIDNVVKFFFFFLLSPPPLVKWLPARRCSPIPVLTTPNSAPIYFILFYLFI